MGVDVRTGSEVWKILDTALRDERFVVLDEPEGLERVLRLLTSGLRYSPKVWQDAYLAAFAIASGRKLVSFDSGFKNFEGLAVEILRVDAQRAG
jgi:uncharacterized protein